MGLSRLPATGKWRCPKMDIEVQETDSIWLSCQLYVWVLHRAAEQAGMRSLLLVELGRRICL